MSALRFIAGVIGCVIFVYGFPWLMAVVWIALGGPW